MQPSFYLVHHFDHNAVRKTKLASMGDAAERKHGTGDPVGPLLGQVEMDAQFGMNEKVD